MRTLACVIFVLSLGLAETAVALGGGGGAGGGGTGTGWGRAAQVAFGPAYRDRYHHRHAQRPKSSSVAHGMARAHRHDLRPSGYVEELTRRGHGASPEMSTQMPLNDTYTLLPGLPLLGLDPRSPSTWALYNQMLPPLFSEVSVSTPVGLAQ